MVLSILSAIFLREMVASPIKTLLYERYEFHSLLRIKITYGHSFYWVKCITVASALESVMYTIPIEKSDREQDVIKSHESLKLLQMPNVPEIHIGEKVHFYLLTDGEHAKIMATDGGKALCY